MCVVWRIKSKRFLYRNQENYTWCTSCGWFPWRHRKTGNKGVGKEIKAVTDKAVRNKKCKSPKVGEKDSIHFLCAEAVQMKNNEEHLLSYFLRWEHFWHLLSNKIIKSLLWQIFSAGNWWELQNMNLILNYNIFILIIMKHIYTASLKTQSIVIYECSVCFHICQQYKQCWGKKVPKIKMSKHDSCVQKLFCVIWKWHVLLASSHRV